MTLNHGKRIGLGSWRAFVPVGSMSETHEWQLTTHNQPQNRKFTFSKTRRRHGLDCKVEPGVLMMGKRYKVMVAQASRRLCRAGQALATARQQ